MGATGSTILGTAGSLYGMNKAKDSQKKAGQSAQSNVDFQRDVFAQNQKMSQQMLDDWESMFGGIQDNLSEYYNNLDPAKFAAQGKQELQQSLDKQMTQFNEEMGAKGMQTSGMRAQASKEQAFAQAMGNASIDVNAPEQVAQMQQGFVQAGSGKNDIYQSAINSNIQGASNVGGAYNSQTNMYSGMSSMWSGMSNQFAGMAHQGALANDSNFNDFMGSMGGGMMSDERLKENVMLVDNVQGINVYTWDWKAKGTKQHNRGVIAQEVMEAYPEAVSRHTTTGYYMVDYSRLPGGIL